MRIILRNILLLLLVTNSSIVVVHAQSPNWQWAKSSGGIQEEQGTGITTDIDGNVYVVGTFRSSTLSFNNITLTNKGGGCPDGCTNTFLVKYDSIGNVLWATNIGDTGTVTSNGVCTDGEGNVYLTGGFTSASLSIANNMLLNSKPGQSDIFLAKYTSDGIPVWGKSTGNSGWETGSGIASDGQNIYITGYFNSQNIAFGNINLANSGSGHDLFIAKYSSSGSIEWAKNGIGQGNDYGIGVDAGANGIVSITGTYYSSSLTINNSSLNNAGYTDIFVAQFDQNGALLWLKGGTGIDMDRATAIAMDANGNTYITGFFSSQDLTFGSNTLLNSGSYYNKDLFVVKYDQNGSEIWAKNAMGTESNGVDVDVYGNVYLTGNFWDEQLVFGDDTLTNTTGVSNKNMFLIKYDEVGNEAWGKASKGTLNDFGSSITTNDRGNIYLTGAFNSSTIVFDTTVLNSQGKSEFFFAKLQNEAFILRELSLIEAPENGLNLLLYPNPNKGVFIIEFGIRPCTVEIFDLLGKRVRKYKVKGQNELFVSGLSHGIYTVRVSDGVIRKTKKVVVE